MQGSSRSKGAQDSLESEEAQGARRSGGSFEGFGINAAFVAEIRERYAVDPDAVDQGWDQHFSSSHAPPAGAAAPSQPLDEAPAPAERPLSASPASADPEVEKQGRVLRLIHSFRARGHRIAHSDPLGQDDTYFPELDPAHYGFGDTDLDVPVHVGNLEGPAVQTLREILGRLRNTYCRSIGVEFTHIQDPGRKAWLQQRMEHNENTPNIRDDERWRIFEKLSASEFFERFLHTKFIGQKRFSLEGAESLIPLLDTVVEYAPEQGIREIVFGMAHRGRLNVLSNILGKSFESIFSEFEDNPLLDSPFGSGDVKYHKGFSKDRRTRDGETVHLTLTSNPSHLEAVDPVCEGRAKAKQVRAGDDVGETIMPVVVHGDAAFAGQGIVFETMNLSRLRGYSTGGTLHVIVNNQIGFTTTPAEARSTLYCSDIAKAIQAPIFHVNGDEPEAVLHCVELAMDYRMRFHEDVVIDMVCYRRHGHNEGDEPSFTQPGLYKRIRQRPSVRRLYAEKLVASGALSEQDAQRIEAELSDQLQQALEMIHTRPPGPDEPYEPRGPWAGFERVVPAEEAVTAVSMEQLERIASGMGTLPPGFEVHSKLATLLERRRKAISEDSGLDWAMAEALAFGSLVLEGYPVRLSGQDSSRGTFSHRHAVFVDQGTGEEYAPLDQLSEDQARFEVYDSLLSEAAVLGFEYGYSLADPTTLTLWEAQFGDFANGAQVIIDQFISSAHVKWQRMSGLVMLLPHGYEGQGPEHSSARIERFLQMCAEDCMQVVNCTTPAQYFHVLRRQMIRNYRVPLVVFTPKSLLRSPMATSSARELSEGRFETLISDPIAGENPNQVRRVLMCSGKVYYDVIAEREKRFGARAGEVAVLRVEQLYPWPEQAIAETIRLYDSADRIVWVQEEPQNMGGWTFVRERVQGVLVPFERFTYAGRAPAASPATGSMRIHRHEQAALVDKAFEGLD